MGRGRHAGYDGQREMILAQAATLFARGGYPGTSMNQVAEACGLSKATLYHYYRDKYELLVNIAEEHVTRLQGIVDYALAEDDTPQGQMRALIRRLVEEYANAQNEHRVLTEGQPMWFAATYGDTSSRGGGSNLPAWTHDGHILYPRRTPGARIASW